jgi:hypothetical protein
VRQLVIGHVFVIAGCGLMALPIDGGGMVAIGITIAGFGMGIQSPAAFIAIAPEGDPRAAAAVPLARNLGAGVGVAMMGGAITALAGAAALVAAEDGAVVPALHSASQGAFLIAAVVCAAALPAARLAR